MQKIDAQSIGDVLRQTIQECNMSAKLDEQRAISLWRTYVGDGIADRCGHPSVSNGVMCVAVRSAVLRHEMTMNRSSLIKLINEHLEKNVIKEIRFVGG